jgi:hypothetical protein
MSACAVVGALPFGGDSWQEEVLLHDGRKLIISRSQTYGGRHEIGQSLPIKEHTITFTLPETNKTITWTSEYDESLGRTNFNLLAVHVLNGTPYIVVEPNLILSYNKWGRPNPPYVLFKYDGTAWQRIPLESLPEEFKGINVAITSTMEEGKTLSRQGFVSMQKINKLNSRLTQKEYKAIIRTPIDYGSPRGNSGILIRTEDGGWLGMDWFSSQPSLEACLKKCSRERVSAQDCPCHTLFKGK